MTRNDEPYGASLNETGEQGSVHSTVKVFNVTVAQYLRQRLRSMPKNHVSTVTICDTTVPAQETHASEYDSHCMDFQSETDGTNTT